MGFEPTISWATARRLRPLGYAHRNGLPVATKNYKPFRTFFAKARLDWGRLCAGMWDGDGSPHPRGHRRGGGMGSRPCLHGGRLYAGKWDGDGSPHPRGHGRGGGLDSCPCLHGGRLYAGMWDGDGSPHPRGHRRGGGMGSCPVSTGVGSAREEQVRVSAR